MVAVEKPAGLATIADHHGSARTLVDEVARLLGKDAADLHVTSRLDVDVSGVVVLALTKLARDRLREARAAGTYARVYLAIAERSPATREGTWDASIGRASDARHRKIDGRDAVAATTRFHVIRVLPSGSALLRLEPLTGRTHQLRLHASHAGAPLLGDSVYGGSTRIVSATGAVRKLDRVMLHALCVTVPDANGAPFRVVSPPPRCLVEAWLALGGGARDFEDAAAP
jgi:23S rRNA-/tRNA-specific pseudouridylate synthase